MQISVVVPVYNSAASLPALVARLQPVLEQTADAFELVLVNDGSRDESWDVITKLSSAHEWIHGINLMRNYGQHSALLCGIRQARYDAIVTIDDDLQNPPEEIPRLLARLEEGFDVVYGTPEHQRHGIWRDLASVVTKLALRGAMGSAIARDISAFRVFRRQLRNAFQNYQSSFVSIDVLLTWGTSRFSSVRVRHDPREHGASNYSFYKLLTHGVNMMCGFSTLPLQVASAMGFICTLFGVGVLAYVLGAYWWHGGSIPGFPFLASTMAILGGTQLFALGVIGEYIARMHFRMMERPPYAVRDKTESGVQNEP
ncbi:MAG: glycosyltransferase family 2 protein [Candidatus Hydrogenedentes bacterium]|nr:glycosyltransferase family 2 protein [Candidatus Hydrogenedentota bacterium]